MMTIFEEYKNDILQAVNQLKARLPTERRRSLVPYQDYAIERLRQQIFQDIASALPGITIDGEKLSLKIPPAHVQEDFAIEVFSLAKERRLSGDDLNALIKALSEDGSPYRFRPTLAGGFINFTLDRQFLFRNILSQIIGLGDRYGESDVNQQKLALIDYSAPNIAKPIGVGHLRSTIIGQALANIYHKTGYTVIRDNHLGDWGTQFGSVIYAYQQWADPAQIKQEPIRALKDLYVRFHQESEANPALKDVAREYFSRLERRDGEFLKLWKEIRDLSILDFEKIYQRLGIHFDAYIGESYFLDDIDRTLRDCLKSGLCEPDPDSQVIAVKELDGLPSFLLRKQDGSSLYITRDLATIKFREEEFSPDALLYVVGEEQKLHFEQLFELSKRMGYARASTKLKHVGFGLVMSGAKKMSTRRGTLIELDELLTRSTQEAYNTIRAKNDQLSDEEIKAIAEQVGIGAIIYNDLKQDRIKNISFEWEKMLNLEGGSGPYIQYTFVRIQSILAKFDEAPADMVDADRWRFEDESEFLLARKLMFFPWVILRSQAEDHPHYLCLYLDELAQIFNNFYGRVSVIKTDDAALKYSRVLLIKAVAIVIKQGLCLLNIQVPTRM